MHHRTRGEPARQEPNRMRPPSPPTVVIADAQLLFAEALADALSAWDDLAVLDPRPRSATELVATVQAGQPDVALVDYYLDLAAPEQLVADIAERHPATKVVFLSWLHDEQTVTRVLEAGAVGYLPKSCDVEQVAEAVERAHTGERPVFDEQLHNLLTELERRRASAQHIAARLAELTPRELEVLEWLAAGYTTEGMAGQLGATPRTIQTHIRNLKAKTGARTQLEAVRMAHGKAAVCLPDSLPA